MPTNTLILCAGTTMKSSAMNSLAAVLYGVQVKNVAIVFPMEMDTSTIEKRLALLKGVEVVTANRVNDILENIENDSVDMITIDSIFTPPDSPAVPVTKEHVAAVEYRSPFESLQANHKKYRKKK